MKSEFARWLAVLLVCSALVFLSMQFVDRPVATFMHSHRFEPRYIKRAVNFALYLVPVFALAPLICGLTILGGRHLWRWAESATLAGLSLVWALAVNDILLKTIFGRFNPQDYLGSPSLYGFDWLHGDFKSSFPSGHMAIVSSIVFVLWNRYPALSWLWAMLVALVMIGLVMVNWHFVADVLGGVFIGWSASTMTLALDRHRQRIR